MQERVIARSEKFSIQMGVGKAFPPSPEGGRDTGQVFTHLLKDTEDWVLGPVGSGRLGSHRAHTQSHSGSCSS